ncbi:hypothetical protein Ccar_08740 [Clostridium carboxidivorans P7]|uniref:Tetratricopeptide repeat protein n=1 Tax=Clostridium carboxidivorans P7 TaxID=536227 RepID=C6PZ52_9CLOT|nr:hypothetical protein [Clostridium carboxidivorans]AKN30924.1 hypothetical protein Ccar_08740 [Clostridium carboxidivorans P7]EET85494.1 tetratricopeptide repeat protein [Clostridium carboxidivorans P7]EFG88823.1 hypothetical protein CLCAR_1570 [Clostridium carboxidivorans P7]
MKITKKEQIIKLYKEGLRVEDIVKKGFGKKYVNQVLKFLKIPVKPNDKTNIKDIKELASLLETLENKSDKINISINISIKVDDCK